MSKHSVRGGDFAGLMQRFAQFQEKARRRAGQSFRIIVVQEAGLDGFWIHRALQNEGIESHVVDAASIATSRRRRRAKTDKIDGETLVRVMLAHKRGEPRVCAMVKVPTPDEEDRRHLCRECKALTAERVRHVNRIKGFLFSQGVSGYQPLRRDRRQRLEDSKPATAAHSLSILKRSSTVSSIGLNFFSNRSRPWRSRGTRCWL
jgi:transposase